MFQAPSAISLIITSSIATSATLSFSHLASKRHLSTFHLRYISLKQRQDITQYCLSLSNLIDRLEDLAQPLDYSVPLPFLPIFGGFACGQAACRYVSRSEKAVYEHIARKHRLQYRARADNVKPINLQSWHSDKRAQHWIVRSGHGPAKASYSEKRSTRQTLQAQELDRLAQLDQHVIAQDASAQQTETTLWLGYTQWPAQLANRPLDIIAATAVQPTKSLNADYILSTWESQDFLSPLEDELKLCQLVCLLDTVFDRCLQTVSTTPDVFCYWLKSFRPMDFHPKLFAVLETDTGQRRYISYWKRFICFIFRTWRTEHRLRDQIYGIRFSPTQERLMAQLWALLDQVQQSNRNEEQDTDQEADHEERCGSDEESDQERRGESDEESDLEDEGEEDDQEIDDQQLGRRLDLGQDLGPDLTLAVDCSDQGHDPAAEQLFQLSCLFWTDLSKKGKTFHLPLVYFTGVLGI